MTENNQKKSQTRLSVSIPDARFDEFWAAMPDRLKASLTANPCAVVSDRDGGTILFRDFVTMKNYENNLNS